MVVITDVLNDIEIGANLDKVILNLDSELSGVRTGQATSNLLNNVLADSYGNKLPINQLATVSSVDNCTLNVHVWDSENTQSVEHAISTNPLGFSATTNGQNIKVVVPALTGELRNKMSKLVKEYAEKAKIAVRNIRRAAVDKINALKSDGLSEDDINKLKKYINAIVTGYEEKIDQRSQNKQNDILKI